MPAPSNWDRIPWPDGPNTGWHLHNTGESATDMHARVRIEPFERALAATSDGAVAESVNVLLIRELVNRRQWWSAQFSGVANHSGAASGWRRFDIVLSTRLRARWLFLIIFEVILLIIVTIVVTSPRPRSRAATPGVIWVLIGLMSLGVPIAVGGISRYLRRRRLARSIARQSCPDCDYDLSALVSADGTGAFGPRQCPDCATMWPLVPPPMPRDLPTVADLPSLRQSVKKSAPGSDQSVGFGIRGPTHTLWDAVAVAGDERGSAMSSRAFLWGRHRSSSRRTRWKRWLFGFPRFGRRRMWWKALVPLSAPLLVAAVLVAQFYFHIPFSLYWPAALVVVAISLVFTWHYDDPRLRHACRERVKFFDQAIQQPGDLSRLCDEYQQRCLPVYTGSMTEQSSNANRRFQAFDRRARIGWIVAYAAMALPLLFHLALPGVTGSLRGLLPCFSMPLFLAALIYSNRRCTAAQRALASCLADRTCPNCRYDLSGIPNAIDPAQLGGIPIGPQRCPECGARWPLVPPPLPQVEADS